MDALIQSYMEETEDMLQKAEECIIRLEIEYSSADVNELFRLAHTIKGSSQMVGYEDIGNLMHKIEDMLDCARNGSILFDQSIVSLCFEGLDIVKKMLQYKKEPGSQENMENLVVAASRTKEKIEDFIKVNKKVEEKTIAEQNTGIVTSLLNKKAKGRNKFHLTFFIEEDTPMISPLLIMILNSVEGIGTLVYASVDDNFFSGSTGDNNMKTFDIIISTDTAENELYTYFSLFYIEKINIVDLSRNAVKKNDYSYIDPEDMLYVTILEAFMSLYAITFSSSKKMNECVRDIDIIKSLYFQAVTAFGKMKNKNIIENYTTEFNGLYSNIIKNYNGQVTTNKKIDFDIQTQLINLIERAFTYARGKYIFSVFKIEKGDFIVKLKYFIEMLKKSSTFIFLIDLSALTMLSEDEVKDLIKIKKQLQSQNIEVALIAEERLNSRRIINIFDSIKEIEEFHVFSSQLEAVFAIFDSANSFNRISKKIKDEQNE
jgi:two-component system chemotaxis sensor kinase CheA